MQGSKKVIAFLGMVMVAGAAAYAQDLSVHQTKKLFGFQDPVSGEFHPLGKGQRLIPDAATTAPTTGTLEVVVTIALKTPLPKGGSVLCSTDFIASSFSLTTGAATSYTETAEAIATVAGAGAKCTLKIPYSWVLAPASSTIHTTLDGSLGVSMIGATTTTVLEGEVLRGHGQDIVSATKLPANGAVTVYDVNATL